MNIETKYDILLLVLLISPFIITLIIMLLGIQAFG